MSWKRGHAWKGNVFLEHLYWSGLEAVTSSSLSESELVLGSQWVRAEPLVCCLLVLPETPMPLA